MAEDRLVLDKLVKSKENIKCKYNELKREEAKPMYSRLNTNV